MAVDSLGVEPECGGGLGVARAFHRIIGGPILGLLLLEWNVQATTGGRILECVTQEASTNLSTNLAGLELANPVILAAGTCGYMDELGDVLDLSRVGAIVSKSITVQPREGNETWRIVDCRGGMLNAIGLANVGLDHFLEHVAPRLVEAPTCMIGSIAGFSIDDYVQVAGAMDGIEAISAVELNVSCPNVAGGVEFGADPALLSELIRAVRPALPTTRLFVKLGPVTFSPPGMVAIAKAAIEPGGVVGGGGVYGPNQRPGADGLCISNTMPAMAIDVRTRLPRLSNVTGGLSGPALHPIAVKLVHDVYRGIARDSETPIVGVGGVMRWEDAAEFVLAGASAVEMGTALFADPRSPLGVIKGLGRWVTEQGAGSIGELVGGVGG